jgi:SAM-dependent methyltransferase
LESIELAKRGAGRVIGIDIRENALERAKENARGAGVEKICEFGKEVGEPVDLIVSIDCFEHFADPSAILDQMWKLLKPNGLVAVSFGPPWYHPFGGHLFSVIPWAHLMFSEKALILWRNDLRNDGATRFSEVEGGLNKMTIRRFKRLVRKSNFQIQMLETVPIRKLAFMHTRLTQEFTTSIVRCKLSKSVAD